MTILYEKYRATSLNDYVGNEQTIKELSLWLKTYHKSAKERAFDKANLILLGPTGIGKTTLALALLKDHSFDVIELNASDTRNGDQIDNIFRETLKSGYNVMSMLNHQKKSIAILMDEIDGLSLGDKGGMKALKTYLQKNNFYCPIVMTSNIAHYTLNGNKKLAELKKYSLIYTLESLPQFKIFKRIEYIVKSEGLDSILNAGYINILIQNCGSDFRFILNTIELIVMLHRTDELEIDKMIDYIQNNSKDTNYDLYQSTEKLFLKDTDPNVIFNNFDGERYNLPLSSYDFLYKYIRDFTQENLEIIQKIHHCFTDSIRIENAIYNGLRWDLFETQCCLTAFSVFLLFRFIKRATPTKFQQSRVSSRMNCINANRDTRNKICQIQGIDPNNYHIYIELLMNTILTDPSKIREVLDNMNMSKEEMLRLLKSADCKTNILNRLRDLGFITQRELDRNLI